MPRPVPSRFHSGIDGVGVDDGREEVAAQVEAYLSKMWRDAPDGPSDRDAGDGSNIGMVGNAAPSHRPDREVDQDEDEEGEEEEQEIGIHAALLLGDDGSGSEDDPGAYRRSESLGWVGGGGEKEAAARRRGQGSGRRQRRDQGREEAEEDLVYALLCEEEEGEDEEEETGSLEADRPGVRGEDWRARELEEDGGGEGGKGRRSREASLFEAEGDQEEEEEERGGGSSVGETRSEPLADAASPPSPSLDDMLLVEDLVGLGEEGGDEGSEEGMEGGEGTSR